MIIPPRLRSFGTAFRVLFLKANPRPSLKEEEVCIYTLYHAALPIDVRFFMSDAILYEYDTVLVILTLSTASNQLLARPLRFARRGDQEPVVFTRLTLAEGYQPAEPVRDTIRQESA